MEKKDYYRFAFDLVCLMIFCIPLLAFNTDVVPVSRNGYFCSDTSIRYPYRDGQIPSWALFVEGVLAFCFLSALAEWYIAFNDSKNAEISTSSKSVGSSMMKGVYRAVGYLLIGACANNFFTDVGKHTVGRLRPHFLDICGSNVTCTDSNANEYITNYQCMNTQHPLIPAEKFHDRLLDARKSFPSGHSSFALFCALYTVLYLEYRVSRYGQLRLLRHLAQVGAVAWSLWVCGTRIVDFKHRFSDVAAGIIVGSFTALCTFYVYRISMRLQKRSKNDAEDIPMVGVMSSS